jgi:hypothetical protein
MSAANEAKRNGDRVVHAAVNAMMRGLGFRAQSALIDKTPRDTGRAAGNWNISTGAPDTSTNESMTEAGIAAKKAEGEATIARIDFAKGEEMYATNGLPYIQALEDGHSQQAPAGMVAVTVQELRPVADQIARKVAK